MPSPNQEIKTQGARESIRDTGTLEHGVGPEPLSTALSPAHTRVSLATVSSIMALLGSSTEPPSLVGRALLGEATGPRTAHPKQRAAKEIPKQILRPCSTLQTFVNKEKMGVGGGGKS